MSQLKLIFSSLAVVARRKGGPILNQRADCDTVRSAPPELIWAHALWWMYPLTSAADLDGTVTPSPATWDATILVTSQVDKYYLECNVM